jgi:hypothetical protein
MRQLLTEIHMHDDDYFEFHGNNNSLVKNIVGHKLFHQNRVGFEVEYTARDWNCQTQLIKIYLIGELKDIFWFQMQFEPKI